MLSIIMQSQLKCFYQRKFFPIIRQNLFYIFKNNNINGIEYQTFVTSPLIFDSNKNKYSNSNHYIDYTKTKEYVLYIVSAALFITTLPFLAVPLYRSFCRYLGYGGLSADKREKESVEKIRNMKKYNSDRVFTVKFSGETNSKLPWTFKPLQNLLHVKPGETVLAFYNAKNLFDKPLIGVSTYSIHPPDATQYFHKIQCFCFEEQLLRPGEDVDMPVFFYLDPEILTDHNLKRVTQINLLYTFFEAKDGLQLPSIGEIAIKV